MLCGKNKRQLTAEKTESEAMAMWRKLQIEVAEYFAFGSVVFTN